MLAFGDVVVKRADVYLFRGVISSSMRSLSAPLPQISPL